MGEEAGSEPEAAAGAAARAPLKQIENSDSEATLGSDAKKEQKGDAGENEGKNESKTVIAKDGEQKDLMKLLVTHSRRQAMISTEPTIIFVGAQGAGKSTLMHRFINPEKDEDPKPTLALDYSFMKKASKDAIGGKEVCHMWEIGGGSALASLLDVPLSESVIKNVVVAIVVDLSKPNEAFACISFWLERIRSRLLEIEKALRAKIPSSKVMDQLRDRAAKRFGETHADNKSQTGIVGKGMVKHTGITVLIIANKNDEFAQKVSEMKRFMGQILRFLAHSNGAALVYTSSKHKASQGALRNLLNQFLFKGPPVKTKNTEYNKQDGYLMVPAGADTLKDIGAPPVDESAVKQNTTPLGLWRGVFESYFGQSVDLTMGVAAVPEFDPKQEFAEKDVDIARAQKEEELHLYRQAAEKAAAELAKAAAKPSRPAGPATGASSAKASGRARPTPSS